MVEIKCRICGVKFSVYFHRKNTAKYCSQKCYRVSNIGRFVGEKSVSWKGGKVEHSEGYYLIKLHSHPYADGRGYIPEHRLVMEKKIGRYINPKKEHVHHIDKNKKNNILENLQLTSIHEHGRLDAGWFKENNKWFKVCKGCGKELEINAKNFYFRSSGRCLPRCKGCSNDTKKKGAIIN